MLTVSEFRKRTKEVFTTCHNAPVQVRRGNTIYLIMPQEHYINLCNKIKFPGIMGHPVQTIVHLRTETFNSS